MSTPHVITAHLRGPIEVSPGEAAAFVGALALGLLVIVSAGGAITWALTRRRIGFVVGAVVCAVTMLVLLRLPTPTPPLIGVASWSASAAVGMAIRALDRRSGREVRPVPAWIPVTLASLVVWMLLVGRAW